MSMVRRVPKISSYERRRRGHVFARKSAGGRKREQVPRLGILGRNG
jgi:hypothetical protein